MTRLWVPAWCLLLAGGCEVVTGFDDLTFEPETCEPESAADTCANLACGVRTNNCGTEVECPDTCAAPFACGVGGVNANECGCTGGSAHQTPLAPETCPVAGTLGGRSYYFCGAFGFEDARAFCQSFGTDLAVIGSAAEMTFVSTNLAGNSWIGLFAEPPCDAAGCAFGWVDGTPLSAFTNWNTDEPNNSNGGEFCVEVQSGGANQGRWNDVPCTNVLNTICETTCPDG